MSPRSIIITAVLFIVCFATFIGGGVYFVFSSKAYQQNTAPHLVKQFDNNGHLIGQWTSIGLVGHTGNSASFEDAATGKHVTVTGTLQITIK